MRILFIFVFLSSVAFGQNCINNYQKTLSDGEEAEYFIPSFYLDYKKIIFPPIPIILKSYIPDGSRNTSLYSDKRSSEDRFNLERNDVFNNWHTGFLSADPWTSYGISEGWFRKMISSSFARKEIFNYVKKTYLNLSYYYPNNFKKDLITEFEKIKYFLINYPSKQNEFILLEKKYKSEYFGFVEKVGLDEAWLYRRIEKDKIPISEMIGYLDSLIEITKREIEKKTSPYDCIKKTTINNEIIICDLDDALSIFPVKPKRKNLPIKFKKTKVKIKCIKSGIDNYYLINDILFDSYLNKINR